MSRHNFWRIKVEFKLLHIGLDVSSYYSIRPNRNFRIKYFNDFIIDGKIKLQLSLFTLFGWKFVYKLPKEFLTKLPNCQIQIYLQFHLNNIRRINGNCTHPILIKTGIYIKIIKTVSIFSF
jgi:hypothetical protein